MKPKTEVGKAQINERKKEVQIPDLSGGFLYTLKFYEIFGFRSIRTHILVQQCYRNTNESLVVLLIAITYR